MASTTNLGACEWFVWDLRRSHLIDNETLDPVVAAFLMQHPEGEPPALAQHMVEQKLLTPFQAERLLQGKSHDLVLGPYALLEAVGAGSMGTVYRAISNKDHKLYAVKVLPRRSTWNARMARRQVTAFEKCKHPAVVPFVDVGTAGAMHYLTWPFVEGESLQSLVQREGKLAPDRANRLALHTAEGLQLCHQNGLIHGMLKPSNLLVGSDQQIRILDFGVGTLLAQSEEESLVDTRSTANVLASGLDCVSPESILDPTKRTPAGDQYSLGCVLYFCLAGRLPFEGSAADKLQAHRTKQPDPIRDLNPAVPDDLAAVVDRLMQKEPSARYADMKEVIAALRPIAEPAAAPSEPSEVRAVSPTDAQLPQAPPVLVPDFLEEKKNGTPSSGDEGIQEVSPTLGEHAVPLPDVAAQDRSKLELAAPRKHAIPTPPELSVTPFAPAAAAETPSPDRPASPPPKPKLTPLPSGTTQVLEALPPSATDYSVFEMPAVNDPLPPPHARGVAPRPAATKLQPQAPPEDSVQDPDDVIAWKSSKSREQLKHPDNSLEERLGFKGIVLLASFAGVLVFLLGCLLFSFFSR
jgi:serine/threonine-protein kinase